MNASEKRTAISLAAIFALRMFGLFLILPVFALHATHLPSGDNIALVGLTIGAYGLTQALLQIPYGMASDRLGRKPVILLGLLLFALGSVIAALASDLPAILLGRIIQGAGAISAAVTALAIDLTREEHRTKAMALIGSSIGMVFALSLVLAPLLYQFVGMSGIFWLTAALALLAIVVLYQVVPEAPRQPIVVKRTRFSAVLADFDLMRLNFGVFVLHLTQTAMWVVIPGALVTSGALPLASHWQVYLFAVLASFAVMVPAIVFAEKRGRIKFLFICAIALLAVVQFGFLFCRETLAGLAAGLFAFFVAFNILEATQPSLIARFAPPQAKGAALGIYNTTQSLGLFCGGALGGAIVKFAGVDSVFVACLCLSLLWLSFAVLMRIPALRKSS